MQRISSFSLTSCTRNYIAHCKVCCRIVRCAVVYAMRCNQSRIWNPYLGKHLLKISLLHFTSDVQHLYMIHEVEQASVNCLFVESTVVWTAMHGMEQWARRDRLWMLHSCSITSFMNAPPLHPLIDLSTLVWQGWCRRYHRYVAFRTHIPTRWEYIAFCSCFSFRCVRRAVYSLTCLVLNEIKREIRFFYLCFGAVFP